MEPQPIGLRDSLLRASRLRGKGQIQPTTKTRRREESGSGFSRKILSWPRRIFGLVVQIRVHRWLSVVSFCLLASDTSQELRGSPARQNQHRQDDPVIL